MTTEERQQALGHWAQEQIAELMNKPGITFDLQNLCGDASFRRYFRASLDDTSFIVVDAPPQQEDNQKFVKIAQAFRQGGVYTPEVYRVDYQQGFMLQEDFGDQLFLGLLQASKNASAEITRLYRLAIDTLVKLQKYVPIDILPAYDRALLHQEMALFPEWFCTRFLALKLSQEEQYIIARCQAYLEDQALTQTRVAVHRDYHSRNLMVPDTSRYAEDHVPGVIDFQDAVAGPYSYDLVSLLRDCYISWSPELVEELALYYRESALAGGVIPTASTGQFLRDFDLMGLQRNLKVIGIFARLAIRDNKQQYLADIPQAINYFLQVASRYPDIAIFVSWFRERVLPVAREKLPAGELCKQ